MTSRYDHLTPVTDSNSFYAVRSQLQYWIRHYREADRSSVSIEENVRLSVKRVSESPASEAIIHICDFRVAGEAEYARFRLNDMRQGTSSHQLDLINEKFDEVNPNEVPLNLSPLHVQNELGFMAIRHLRARAQEVQLEVSA